jgi:hypothetical protein
MSIGFRMKTLEEIREELAKLTDAQLFERGKTLRQFAKPRPGQGPDVEWTRQLNEARAQWKCRHPPKKFV